MQTYQFLAYQIDELPNIFGSSIHSAEAWNFLEARSAKILCLPGIWAAEISFWLFHYMKSDIMPPPCLFIHCSGVVRKNPDMLFASNSKTFVVMYFISRLNPPMLLISS